MANKFRYKILLPPVVDADTVNVELAAKVTDKDGNDVPEPLKTFSRLETETEYVFPQDATVMLSLVNIDDVGNRSDASTREFVVLDNVPPARPGELAVQVMGEE